MHISKTLCTFATSKGTKNKLKQSGGKTIWQQNKARNFYKLSETQKKCAMRDAYDYMLYLADDGAYSITRLFGELTNNYLYDMKEIVGFATFSYTTNQPKYFSMKNRSWKAKAFCENMINRHGIKH